MRTNRLKPTPLSLAMRLSMLGASCVAMSLYGPVYAQSAVVASNEAALPTVNVTAGRARGYAAPSSTTATRTDTLLRDVPQAVSVVTQQLIKDQGMQSIADVVRYMPGIGMAQGEGNRDTPIFRGNSSTADFFIDGMRDDVQYFRDLYNIDRVEAFKGPNGMIFGRGGSGGVINRVTKEAGWKPVREVTLQAGSYENKRATVDINQPINDAVAFRLNAMIEESESYRDGVELRRKGINPTMTMRPDSRTKVTLGAEYFEDDRIADRGVPSFRGRPLATDSSTFFGNAETSPTGTTVKAVNASFERELGNGAIIRNNTRYADYDKFYQNVFPGAVNAAGTTVSISAYNNATQRENLFNQTDFIFSLDTGVIKHKVLTGLELGRQVTSNFRNTGYFTSITPTTTSVQVPVSNPITTLPITFQQSATDADNKGTAKVASVYVQDQIRFSPRWEAIVGVRYDKFDMDFVNQRTGQNLGSSDDLLSPRAGLIYKPMDTLSLYANYSLSYLPRAGEQLSSLTLNNQALEPEKFRNYEVGAKWDIRPDLSFSAALYQLDRSNVAITDPANPTATLLVDGQRTRGIELGLSGQITNAWSVMGGYAYQHGEITRTQSASAQAGATLAQLPSHTFSMWNRYDFSPQWGAGIGVYSRSKSYTSTDNTVALPGFTRVDAAIYYKIDEHLKAQLNIENLLDKDYYASAHNNNNITPGSPRAVRVMLTANF